MARVTLALVLVLLAACGGTSRLTGDTGGTAEPGPSTTPSDDVRVIELDDRRGRWNQAQPSSYRLTVEAQCFCLATFGAPRTVTVEDGRVVSEDPAPDDTADPNRIMTVDDLFDQARAAIDEAEAVEIAYDNEFDFPATIEIDYLIDAIDDEVTYVVTGFEVLSA